MSEETNRQFVLARRPQGALQASDFQWREVAVPAPGTGQVLVRNLLLSIDPANRGWINETPTYRKPVPVGGVMAGFTIGRVVSSDDPSFKSGELVEGDGGWQDFAVLPADRIAALPPGATPELAISALGVTGKTAYFGLLEVGRIREGETVVVSGAAGATGSVAGQIAKIKGCRVVGIAGSDEKCRWITGELGFDAAINYRSDDLREALRANCPDGIDVYFDNVGGPILEAVLFQTNLRGRIVCCGAVSQYDTAQPARGPSGVPGLLIVKRLRMEGFIVMDFFHRRREAERELLGWVEAGRLNTRLDLIEGLENAPQALIGVLQGANTGKRVVRVSS